MPVPRPSLHTHEIQGGEEMESKAYQYGNTTVIIHSPLVNMTKKEQGEWFRREWKAGNPAVRNIVRTILNDSRS